MKSAALELADIFRIHSPAYREAFAPLSDYNNGIITM
jgi:hypothetical protein